MDASIAAPQEGFQSSQQVVHCGQQGRHRGGLRFQLDPFQETFGERGARARRRPVA